MKCHKMAHDNNSILLKLIMSLFTHFWSFLIRWNTVPKVLLTNTLIFSYLLMIIN